MLTVAGQLDRLAELATEVRCASRPIEVKRAEAELKIVRAIVDVLTKHETIARLHDVEVKLADLDQALSQAQGFAGRLDRAVIPPITGGIN